MTTTTANHITTKAFFAATDTQMKNMVLAAIANRYGITTDQAFKEVTDEDAEGLLDYLTGSVRIATALIMKRHGLHA